MNRVIKFRGKRADNTPKNGEWVFGDLTHELKITKHKDVRVIRVAGYDVDKSSIGQFTGLHDKNGKEIFEGDIIAVCGKYPKIIKFIDENAGFSFANIEDLKREKFMRIWQQPSTGWWNDFKNEVEIIGNVHDNSDLVK
jgi:uncharacterized phage protein (TIGR01671 family)